MPGADLAPHRLFSAEFKAGTSKVLGYFTSALLRRNQLNPSSGDCAFLRAIISPGAAVLQGPPQRNRAPPLNHELQPTSFPIIRLACALHSCRNPSPRTA